MRYVDIADAPSEWLELLRMWRNNPRVRGEMINQDEISPEQHARWLEKVGAKNSCDKVRVAVSGDGVPFGVIRLIGIDREKSTSDWGMYIGDEKFLGRGLGKKMLVDLIEWAFVEEKLNELHTTVGKKNERAIAMYKKMGFVITGESGDFWTISLYENDGNDKNSDRKNGE